MAKKYIAMKPIKVSGKLINPGKQIVGLEKRRIEALIRYGMVKVVDDDVMELQRKSSQ